MACFRMVVTAVALYLCFTSVAAAEAEMRNAAPKAKVGQSCDGNGDCEDGLCCYRPDVQNGTVCGKRGNTSDPCSTDTLQENTVQPSCRKDEEGAAETTTPAYSPPYNGACPCEYGLTCDFSASMETARNLDSAAEQEDNVRLGRCTEPGTLMER